MSKQNLPLSDRVLNALSDNPQLADRRLRFETERGRVTLFGSVPSFYQKQLAQEALRQVEGIDEIQNDLEVSHWLSPMPLVDTFGATV